MFKPFKNRIQNGVYGPTSKKWKFHVCLSSLLLGWDLIPPIMKFLFYVIVYATGCNFRVLVFNVLQFSLELVCTTHVVAGENKSFWNMVLWNVLGLTNKHRTHEVAKNFQWFSGADVHRLFSHNKRLYNEDQVAIQILFKTMAKSYVFWPHKGGNPTKAFLRWNFLSTLKSYNFGPWWCGNLSTWNLFVRIMLLPAKTTLFEIWCCAMF